MGPRRDWRAALADHAGAFCRICGDAEIELAHTVGRVHDEKRGKARYVNPLAVVPLCRFHHTRFDGHDLDLWPYLTEAERTWAIETVGEGQARRRIEGRKYLNV